MKNIYNDLSDQIRIKEEFFIPQKIEQEKKPNYFILNPLP